jgi:hypothetical protein
MFWASVVMGFLLANVGFVILIVVDKEVKKPEPLSEKYSFTYRYPLMKNKSDEDYAAWLIQEYYRFIEIAMYVPLGAIVGLALIEIYIFIFFLYDFARPGSAGLTAAHMMFLFTLGVLVSVKYYLWPKIWKTYVLVPLLSQYHGAKRDVINGIFEEKINEKITNLYNKLLERTINDKTTKPAQGVHEETVEKPSSS